MLVGLRPSSPSRQPRLVDARSPGKPGGRPGSASQETRSLPFVGRWGLSRTPASASRLLRSGCALVVADGGLAQRPDRCGGRGRIRPRALRLMAGGRPSAFREAPCLSPDEAPARTPRGARWALRPRDGGPSEDGPSPSPADPCGSGGRVRPLPGRGGPGAATGHGGRAAVAVPAHRVRRPGGQDACPAARRCLVAEGRPFPAFPPDDLSRLRGQTHGNTARA